MNRDPLLIGFGTNTNPQSSTIETVWHDDPTKPGEPGAVNTMLVLENRQPQVPFPNLGINVAATADRPCLDVRAVGVRRRPDGSPEVGGPFGIGISASGTTGARIFGEINGVEASSENRAASGVLAVNTGAGFGVAGFGFIGVQGTVRGQKTVGRVGPFAGLFQGPVRVTGSLEKLGGGFKLDHPLEPTTKYLNHSFVESSDMKNVYDGVAHLDEEGAAWVELPEWFGQINRDYCYQLTAIGGPAPDLHIAEGISENRFRIAGGAAGMKVSWQVSGIRKDPWAEMNRIVVEEDKPEEARGTYLYPEAFGRPETQGEGYAREEELRSRVAQMEAEAPGRPEGGAAPEDSP